MRKLVLTLLVPLALPACATTQTAQQTSAEDCSLVDQDMTGSKITKTQKCASGTAAQGATAPQR